MPRSAPEEGTGFPFLPFYAAAGDRYGETLTPGDRHFLFGLQRQALRYFLDNQAANGMILDRQRNHGPPCGRRLCSTAATGMGCIALALAAAPPYHLLTRQEAVVR